MRPFVYRLARELGLVGWVGNAPEGVVIEAEGPHDALAQFERRLPCELPPQARITECIATSVAPEGSRDFLIIDSQTVGNPEPCASPDLATCQNCLRELFDPRNRRYRYPFLSCSHCGPRYSILQALPFDRERTAMAGFVLCPSCRDEYANPTNHRFHAQTTCCASCGPQLELMDAQGQTMAGGDEALRLAVKQLREGEILALKGVGGFQLLADAGNPLALARLRTRKHRPHKPFALLADWLMTRNLCHVEPAEAALLTAPAAPIVLLRRRLCPHSPGEEFKKIAVGVAPNLPWLGIMLPASPLHHLLLADFGAPLVATSGNRGGEPLCIDEKEALARLAGIADVFLVHDRLILRPLDDSVIRIAAGQALTLRRARGYTPTPIDLTEPMPPMLAVGGHLKNTVALCSGRRAILSQHLGDLDDALTLTQSRVTLDELPRLYGIRPSTVVCDAHPDYASSRLAEATGLPVIAVPHHYAHALACVAEHGLKPPLLALTWDGIGLGDDGGLWGGEFLRIETDGYRRVASFWPLRLPGGEKAVKAPRRVALAALHELYGDALTAHLPEPLRLAWGDSERATLLIMLQRGINAPPCSSVGRLFDAVAALLGLCQLNSFEGQAAMLLEAAAMSFVVPPLSKEGRNVGLWQDNDDLPRIDWRPMLRDLLEQQTQGVATAQLAYRFHASLAMAAVTIAQRISLHTVVLCGGCFQNRLLLELCDARLRSVGFNVYWPQRIPPNDGGLALGQLWAARLSVHSQPTFRTSSNKSL